MLVDEAIDESMEKEHDGLLDRLGEAREEMAEAATNALSLGRSLDLLW